MRCRISSLAGEAPENCYAALWALESSFPLWWRSKQCSRWINSRIRASALAADVQPVAPPQGAPEIVHRRTLGVCHGGMQRLPVTPIGGNGTSPWKRLHLLVVPQRALHEDQEFLRRGGRPHHHLCREKRARQTALCVAARRVVHRKLVSAKTAPGAWLRLDPRRRPRAEAGW